MSNFELIYFCILTRDPKDHMLKQWKASNLGFRVPGFSSHRAKLPQPPLTWIFAIHTHTKPSGMSRMYWQEIYARLVLTIIFVKQIDRTKEI